MSQIPEIIYITDARLSFPHLAEPQVQTDAIKGTTRTTYNGDFIVEKTNPAIQQFMARFSQLAQATWPENPQAAMQVIQNDRKQRCYGNGEEKVNSKTFQVRDGYANMMYFTASRMADKGMPQVIDAQGKAIDPRNTMAVQAELRKMYGGCRVNVAIKPWVQTAKSGNGIGIRADLIAVQFLRDDVAFGDGEIDASGMFGAVGTVPAGFPNFAAPAGFPNPQQAAPAVPAGFPAFLMPQ